MSKHTPGPWEVQAEDGFYVCTGNLLVAAVQEVDQHPTDTDEFVAADATKANARLIAAAPELLEFAEEVRRTGDTRLASMAIAVIAKAIGEAK